MDINIPRIIVFVGVIIGMSIVISNGIYGVLVADRDSVFRYNKLTGSVYLCVIGDGCELMTKNMNAKL